MTASLTALTAYALWTLALLVLLVSLRGVLFLSGRRAINSFSPTGEDVSPLSTRIVRAHANCVENLPVFAAIVAAAHFSNQAAVVDGLAWWLIAARVGQSTVHLISTSSPAVMLRFSFFGAQLAIELYWIGRLLGH